ncbi:MAG: ATP-binding cassette domain-containing protein [Rhodospirillales bacterium]
MLTIDHLTRPGIEPFSMRIGSGECVALTGPSGSGKTLLLRAIADLDPNVGTVTLDGERRDAMPAPRWRRLVAYVPAESGWWADRVGDHFENPGEAAGPLERLGLGADVFDWPVARLSTGERQRLALARSLALSPKALLLDEPTSGLDDATAALVETLLVERLGRGDSILLVSHSRRQARRIAGRRYRIDQGRLEEDGQ